MENRTKKYMISIYYFGLLLGAILMNYVIRRYSEISLSFIEKFQGLDKLQDVKERELFFYILCKRIKQLAVCSYLYFYVAKKLVLYFVDLYFAVVMGSAVTLFVYYYGFMGLLHSVILFFPIVIFYGCIYYMAWLQALQGSYGGKNTARKKVALVMALLLAGTVVETGINYFSSLQF